MKKYFDRDDTEWNILAQKWLEKKAQLVLIEKEERMLREELIQLANNQSSEGAGVRLTHSIRKGSVDYASIPILQEIDLEPYRKPPVQFWTIKAVDLSTS